MKFKKHMVALLLAAASSGVMAQKNTDVQTVAPQAIDSCGNYISANNGSGMQERLDANSAVIWVWGYLSHYNLATLETHQHAISIPTQVQTIHLYLEKFCRGNPLGTLIQASEKLRLDLGGTPLKTSLKK